MNYFLNRSSFTMHDIFIGYQLTRDQTTGLYSQTPIYNKRLDPVPVSQPQRFVSDFVRAAVMPVRVEAVEEVVETTDAMPDIPDSAVGIELDMSVSEPIIPVAEPEPVVAAPAEEKPKKVVRKKAKKKPVKKTVKKSLKERKNGQEHAGIKRSRKKTEANESPSCKAPEDKETKEAIGEEQ